jgi:regulator of cell morphogenesis and NO signaling
MTMTSESTVAEIAAAAPSTIAVFQQHQIDFCCGGRIPLAKACESRGLDVDTVLAELRDAVAPRGAEPNWSVASLTTLIEHIQRRYHQPLREELPRLAAMLEKVVSRHGDHLPDRLLPLQQTFETLQAELLGHMAKEDQVLFPCIIALENGAPLPMANVGAWITSPIAMMEAEHEDAGAALAFIREVTDGFAPPDWACPTFRGLYYGLAQLETDMHVHVHLENNVLFPRAAEVARRVGNASGS